MDSLASRWRVPVAGFTFLVVDLRGVGARADASFGVALEDETVDARLGLVERPRHRQRFPGTVNGPAVHWSVIGPGRDTMLELRPTCEHCNVPLPPSSREARICRYECTFCATCVDTILSNVCPNCGGGFVPRPIRPSTNWRGDNYLGKDPASTRVKHRPVDPLAHARFAATIKLIPPEKR